MEQAWTNCKNILIIRADNMGDLLMSSPAIRAVKETINCKISVLTSSMGAGIARFIPEIDDIITCDLPWVKTSTNFSSSDYSALTERLRSHNFDGAIIFTVYSQNPLPSAMLVSMAGIPRCLAYCRENPYRLLTDWVPEKEPYSFIRHQVRRDLDLVAHLNCLAADEHLTLKTSSACWPELKSKLGREGIDTEKALIVLHAGVSEQKRQYPMKNWIELGRLLLKTIPCQLLLTGSLSEASLSNKISAGIGEESFSLAGKLNLEEFITLVKHSALVISVNTATIHIAAATGSPVIVLYALTNPQHTPWQVKGEIFPFKVPEKLKSRNEVVKFVDDNLFNTELTNPLPGDILEGAKRLLQQTDAQYIPEIVFPRYAELQTIGKFSWLPADRYI